MKMKFWKFWTIAVLVVFALSTGQIYFGLFDFIIANDQTYITLVNIAIWALAQFMLLKIYWKQRKRPSAIADTEMLHYMSRTYLLPSIATPFSLPLLLMDAFYFFLLSVE